MQENKTELSVSPEVLEKMASMAAKEIEGVSGIKKIMDIKSAFSSTGAYNGVRVQNVNGAIEISVFIKLKQGAKAREVAEAVQSNVKDKIQTMTGTAVTRVNVSIADIDGDNSEE